MTLSSVEFFSFDKAYGKWSAVSFTKVFVRMAYANRVSSDQTAHEGAVWLGFTWLTSLYAF